MNEEYLELKERIQGFLASEDLAGLADFIEEQGKDNILQFLSRWQDGVYFETLVTEPQTHIGIQYEVEHFSLLKTSPVIKVLEVMGYTDVENYPSKMTTKIAGWHRTKVDVMNYYEPEEIIDGVEGGLKLDQNAAPAKAAAERG